jgi:hypothetical protein
MCWLQKLVSSILSGGVEETIDEIVGAMPVSQCFTAEPALANGVSQEDENPTKQRRYFVKTGKWVDHEHEELASRSSAGDEVILDRPPVDLKTLFPKLSLR